MERLPKAERFEDLLVWRKSLAICKEIYLISSSGPLSRDFTLKNQLRKASISIISNIAEGFGRYGYQDFRHFLSMANGSSNEVRAQLHLVRELGYSPDTQVAELITKCDEVSRMIKGFRSSLRTPE